MTRRIALLIFLGLSASSITMGAADRVQPPPTALDRVSQQVSGYLERLADVKCTENVLQEKLTPSGKVEKRAASTFDYLIMMTGSSDELSLSESRIAPKSVPAQAQPQTPMLVTNGFSTLFLIFHPYYRNAFRFTELGEEVVNGQHLSKFGFEHLSGRRSPVALALRGKEYPLDLVGTAYVDSGSGAIARIDSRLAAPMDDIGLRAMSASIVYSPVRLAGTQETLRFPTEASVELETKKQHWRNTHHFSNYAEFSVSTEVKVSDTIGNDTKK